MHMIRTVFKSVFFRSLLASAVAFAEPAFATQITLEDLVREVKVALLKVQQDDESEAVVEGDDPCVVPEILRFLLSHDSSPREVRFLGL